MTLSFKGEVHQFLSKVMKFRLDERNLNNKVSFLWEQPYSVETGATMELSPFEHTETVPLVAC